MSLRAWLCLTAFSALVCLAAPARRPAATPRNGKAAASVSDAELEKAIRERFARSKIAADRFTVRVQGGVVTLEGRTDIVQHKATATRLARLAGARRVVNRIEVSEKARERLAANLAQGRRRAQIKRSESAPRSQPR